MFNSDEVLSNPSLPQAAEEKALRTPSHLKMYDITMSLESLMPNDWYRHVEIEIIATYIVEKRIKCAYKRASSVGVMLLVAGGTNENARSCSRSAVRLSARVCS